MDFKKFDSIKETMAIANSALDDLIDIPNGIIDRLVEGSLSLEKLQENNAYSKNPENIVENMKKALDDFQVAVEKMALLRKSLLMNFPG